MAKNTGDGDGMAVDAESQAEEVILRFKGLDADQQLMPLEDFILSLSGWKDYLDTAVSVFLQKRLTLIRSPGEHLVDIRIRQVRAGSQEAVFLVAVASAALGTFLGNKADKLLTIVTIKKLWEWVNALFDCHVREKKSFRSIEETVEALESLAKENGIATDPVKTEGSRFVRYVDECLKKASFPVERSAEEVSIKGDVLGIRIDTGTRRAIKSGFIPGPETAEYFPATVRVRELNLDTGHVRVEVVASQDQDFVSRLDKCWIEDPVLNSPGNPHSQSLDSHVPVDVVVSRKRDKASGETQAWRIRREPPERSEPLFEGKGTGRHCRGVEG